ncbi:MAG: efflux RND transporter periplasmic adaptor subunit [Polyangiaceae bacterium]
MTTPPHLRSRRSLISIALVVALVSAFALLRRPLIAWFTGDDTGANEGKAVIAQAGPLTLHASLDPDPPRQKGNAMLLEVKTASGTPVDDAIVTVDYDMPAMGSMAEMRGGATVSHEPGGHYRARFDLPMGSGTWTLKTKVQGSQGEATQDFTFTVGAAGLSAVGGGNAGAISSAGEIDHYTCSMHTSVNQKGPGKCPICSMALVPVMKQQQDEGIVTIDEGRRQLIGVRTAPVIEAPMRTTLRAAARVSYDESTLTDVSLRVHGFITKLSVNETGQKVSRGQTLFTMYSPELYNAQQDFLLAKRGSLSSAAPDSGSRIEGLAQAARQRLLLLGMSDAQVDAVAKDGTPMESVAFASPASGFIVEKNVVEGASVEAGMRLYRIAALNKVWVDADIYESDLANVRVGEHASVTLDYLPGRSFEARVAYLYPDIDPKTRAGRVRIELANKDLDLHPGMYASVELAAELGTRVQVPAAAIVYTGPRHLVFVDLGQGRFKPQEVQIGTESNGKVEVLTGLHPGDLVATSGIFLIAAEARISSATSYWDNAPILSDGGVTR